MDNKTKVTEKYTPVVISPGLPVICFVVFVFVTVKCILCGNCGWEAITALIILSSLFIILLWIEKRERTERRKEEDGKDE